VYRERLGERLLDSRLYVVKDSTDDVWLGLVGVEVTLLDRATALAVLDTSTAESILKNAVASLGQKQRRQYIDASLKQIASEICIPPFAPENRFYEPICCLSNLAVSPKARRWGVALVLCQQVEDFAQQNGYDLRLKVEEGNVAARRFYEAKLSYQLVYIIPDASALRIDPTAGPLQEIAADTLVPGKRFLWKHSCDWQQWVAAGLALIRVKILMNVDWSFTWWIKKISHQVVSILKQFWRLAQDQVGSLVGEGGAVPTSMAGSSAECP